jgi:hypothetical protein
MDIPGVVQIDEIGIFQLTQADVVVNGTLALID